MNVDAMNALLDLYYGRLEWQRTHSEEHRKAHPISTLTAQVRFYTLLRAFGYHYIIHLQELILLVICIVTPEFDSSIWTEIVKDI